MNKLIVLKTILVGAFCVGFSTTAKAVHAEIKNLYIQAEAVPAEAGTVYISMRDDQSKYVKESTGWGSISQLKGTFEKNGDDPDGSGMFEAVVQAKPADDYEFLCFSYEKECLGDIFLKEDVYKEASSTNSDTRTWTSAILATGINGNGAIINVNTALHSDDNASDIGRDNIYANTPWSETPERFVYAIFRKKGERYPMLDEILPVENVEFTKDDSGKIYNLQGVEVGESYKGIVIKNGKKYIKR